MDEKNHYPICTSIGIEDTIMFLNSLLRIDRAAVSQLVGHRVPCNDRMANHPSVQVQADPGGKNPSVGFLGVLNGMFGIDEEGWGQIAMEIADDGNILYFFKTSPLQRKYGLCLS